MSVGRGGESCPTKTSRWSFVAPTKSSQVIKWIWPERIAAGKMTIIAGDPGLGKSQLALHCAAVITHGGEWPCREGRAPQGSVIVLSAEDSPKDTIIPRLLAYGAVREKIHIIDAVRERETEGRRAFSLQSDLQELEQLIEKKLP
jgi:putative DNA primase/helicase